MDFKEFVILVLVCYIAASKVMLALNVDVLYDAIISVIFAIVMIIGALVLSNDSSYLGKLTIGKLALIIVPIIIFGLLLL